MKKITTQGLQIAVIAKGSEEYISLTDMAKFKGQDTGLIISHWLTTKYTVQFMGIWEQIQQTFLAR